MLESVISHVTIYKLLGINTRVLIDHFDKLLDRCTCDVQILYSDVYPIRQKVARM